VLFVIRPTLAVADNESSLRSAPDLELERQCYDVLHAMRLRDEGKLFKKHFDNAEDLVKHHEAGKEAPLANRMMRKYLERMKRDAEKEIAERFRTLPLDKALDNDDLLYWWGANNDDLSTMIMDWFNHAYSKKSAGKPIPTPAYYLLQYRPPVAFDFEKSRLGTLGWMLIRRIVDGKEWPFSDCGLKEIQSKRAA
jgi:hypothetical protein